MDLPWGIITGLSIILAGVIVCIVYILMLDFLEK